MNAGQAISGAEIARRIAEGVDRAVAAARAAAPPVKTDPEGEAPDDGR